MNQNSGDKGKNVNSVRIQLILCMMLFGTIGTISRFIDMPSSIICLARAFLGVLMILIAVAVQKRKLDTAAMKRNLGWLIIGSFLMCANWICQFEAFKYTTVATGTLCYYMQPIFYIIAAALVLKEKISPKKALCVIAAFCGMILVSGVIQTGFHISEMKGAIYGVVGGFFYAMVVLTNKCMKNISSMNITVAEMAGSVIIMLPYCSVTSAFAQVNLTTVGIICLIILGLVHTGIGYVIYFDAVKKLPAQTVGILSYIDPVEAVLLSAFFLKEPMSIYTIIGAVMILGAAAVSELTGGSNEEAAEQ